MKLQFTAIERFRMDALPTPATDLHVLVNSSHLAVNSRHLPGDSGHLPVSSGHLSDEILTQLRKLAESVTNRGKVGGEEMASVITAVCRGRFLTAEQLASILGRSAEGLRKRFLTPMTREGKLRLRHPQAPNRPDQAYTAADENP